MLEEILISLSEKFISKVTAIKESKNISKLKVNLAKSDPKEDHLFLASQAFEVLSHEVWFIDSACTNYMCWS